MQDLAPNILTFITLKISILKQINLNNQSRAVRLSFLDPLNELEQTDTPSGEEEA